MSRIGVWERTQCRAPACSLEMQENSRHRKACSVAHLVVAARRLMSSRSTLAGWCFTSCQIKAH